MKNHAQQQAQAQRNTHIPKWDYLPNWDVVIQTHPQQSTPLHLPWGAEKGPICVINYPEPKYIFSPPKNAPRRALSGFIYVLSKVLLKPSGVFYLKYY